MRKELGIVTLALLAIATACSVWGAGRDSGPDNEVAPACPALPEDFEESQLIGTWIGAEFGNTDRLIIRDDGTYKQIHDFYHPASADFESVWQRWYLEQDPSGQRRLHLVGMRRCDSVESICNNPGGGIPVDEEVINPCNQSWMVYPSGEVILFVTGTTSELPRGIMIKVPRFPGSDWRYTYELEE